MSTPIANSINNLTISIHILETAIRENDQSSRLPAKPPEPLKSIAETITGDAEMVDLEGAIVLMDRLAAQMRVRARHIDGLTKAIKEATT